MTFWEGSWVCAFGPCCLPPYPAWLPDVQVSGGPAWVSINGVNLFQSAGHLDGACPGLRVSASLGSVAGKIGARAGAPAGETARDADETRFLEVIFFIGSSMCPSHCFDTPSVSDILCRPGLGHSKSPSRLSPLLWGRKCVLDTQRTKG